MLAASAPESAATGARDTVALELRLLPGTAGLDPEIELTGTVTVTSDSSEEGVPTVIAFSGKQLGDTTTLELADGESWTVAFAQEGLWAPRRRIVRHGRETRLATELPVFPAGTVRGTLSPAHLLEAHRADGLVLRIRPTSPHTALNEAIQPCALEEAEWSCSAPAGLLDLRWQLGSLVPEYRWSVSVMVEEATDLGSIALRSGGSLIGVVDVDEGYLPPETEVSVVPFRTATAVIDPTGETTNALARATGVDAHGRFQVVGLGPGSYKVRARAPGLVSSESGPVTIQADVETELVHAVLLAPPARLEVRLSPPRPPFGGDWSLEAHRVDPDSGHVVRTDRAAASEGVGRLEELLPGPFQLIVRDREGSRWLVHEISLDPGENVADLTLDLVEVKGRLHRGGEGISGVLWFGGSSGANALRMIADRSGHFNGLLPFEGGWRVELVDELRETRLVLPPVEVAAPSRGKVARLDINLPDTEVAGEVVDDRGRPVPEARIEIQTTGESLRGRSEARTDEEGQFELLGLEPGLLGLQATKDRTESDWQYVTLVEGLVPPHVRLVVQERRERHGLVMSSNHPIVGAEVIGIPRDADAVGGLEVSGGQRAVTGTAGTFTMSLPAGAEWLDTLIMAPGYAMRFSRMLLDAEEHGSLLFDLERDGGTLTLSLASGEPIWRPGPQPLLLHEGFALPLLLLRKWLHIQGAEPGETLVEIPNVSAGEYSFCRNGDELSRLASGDRDAQCAEGFLAPHAHLALRIED